MVAARRFSMTAAWPSAGATCTSSARRSQSRQSGTPSAAGCTWGWTRVRVCASHNGMERSRDIHATHGSAQRGGIDRGGHSLHGGKDLFGKEAEALFSLSPGHPTVEDMHHEHLKADGPLQCRDLLDDLVRGADGLGRTTRGETCIGHTNVGRLTLEILFVAVDACEAGIIPFEVVVLRSLQLIIEVHPALFGFRSGLSAVHPQEGGGLVQWKTELRPNRVELPHLRSHCVEVVAGDEELPQAMLGSQSCRGLRRECRLDPPRELTLVPSLWANGGRRNLVDLAIEREALSTVSGLDGIDYLVEVFVRLLNRIAE